MQITSKLRYVFAFALLSLSACAPYSPPVKLVHTVPAVLATPRYHRMVNQLRLAGMTVIPAGSQLTVILPTTEFFEEDSTQIRDTKTPSLTLLAKLIKEYGPAPIKVIGYTNKIGSLKMQRIAAKQHAEVIAAYLWSHGLPSQRITVMGKGASEPVAYDDTAAGNQANRRVVVTVN